MRVVRPKNKNEQGNALVEFALLIPMLSILFIGFIQLGFYSYAFISVENAARSAAMRNSFGEDAASDQGGACRIAKEELAGILNWSGAPASSSCQGAPLQVTSTLCSSTVPCSGTVNSVDGAAAVTVTVRFTMPSWLPFRPVETIARNCQMKVRVVQ